MGMEDGEVRGISRKRLRRRRKGFRKRSTTTGRGGDPKRRVYQYLPMQSRAERDTYGGLFWKRPQGPGGPLTQGMRKIPRVGGDPIREEEEERTSDDELRAWNRELVEQWEAQQALQRGTAQNRGEAIGRGRGMVTAGEEPEGRGRRGGGRRTGGGKEHEAPKYERYRGWDGRQGG